MKRVALLVISLSPLALALTQSGGDSAPSDSITQLRERISSGQVKLEFEPSHGYLKSLLKELRIDPNSQTLVFSKTSLQSDHISPKTPRALYFNEDTYVGWIPGAPMIEIMAVHPTQGVLFYTLANEKQSEVPFKKETMECFRCHGGFRANQAPSFLTRSTYVGPSGYPRPFARTFDQTPDTPLKNRWGGWYVTGTHGKQRHMGNELAEGSDDAYTVNTEKGANVTTLDRYFDTKPYLVPHSDIVALMVAEHQMDVLDTLVRVGRRVRVLLSRQGSTNEAIEDAVKPVVDALFCEGEVALTEPIKGTSSFASTFESFAPKDSMGRSLSQLDLKSRLFKYGFSPVVYFDAFGSLPPEARLAVFELVDSRLSKSDAKENELRQILQETLPEFARVSAPN